MSFYADHIQTVLATSGNLDVSAPHAEAFMVLERGTLDSLSASQFKSEVLVAAECVRTAGPAECEALAKSFGLGA